MSMNEHFVENVAGTADLTTEEVQECVNETSLTPEDITHFKQILENGLHTTDSDDKALRVGCFSACLGQKNEIATGAQINVVKIKEIVRTMLIDSDQVRVVYQAVDTCDDQVKNITKKCAAIFKFMVCYVNKMKQYYFA